MDWSLIFPAHSRTPSVVDPAGTRPAGDPAKASKLVASAVFMVLVVGAATFAGQRGRELLTVDDFREVEVAREMAEGRGGIVPRLAGLPFVEKPPGFTLLLATVFGAIGRPSVAAARLISASFAILAVVATVLLGRRVLGTRGGVAAGAFLALSPLYLGTSHTVLLDNALLATTAWALWFLRSALSASDPEGKERFAALAAFVAGLSFLVKGFVGPALLGSGLLLFLGVTRRWRETGIFLRPASVAAFLAPVSTWLVPFLARAPRAVVYEFFVLNHLGRFWDGYDSHPRPWFFYLLTLGYLFAPGILLLPSALVGAWRERREPGGGGGLLALSFFLGPLLLLSLSRAKDSVYLLPAYPALAVLAAGSWVRSQGRAVPLALGISCAAAGGAAWTVSVHAGGWSPGIVFLGVSWALAAGIAVGAALRRRPLPAGLASATLAGLAAVLYFGGPIADVELDRKPWRASVKDLARQASDAPLLLLDPDDIIRGAMGIYRGRTPLEVRGVPELLDGLRSARGAMALVQGDPSEMPERLVQTAQARSLVLEEVMRRPYRRGRTLILLKTHPGIHAGCSGGDPELHPGSAGTSGVPAPERSR